MTTRFAKSAFVSVWLCANAMPIQAQTLPPENDIPEEVLRAEIITEARSPLDGKALSATEFAEFIVTSRQELDAANASAAVRDTKFKEYLYLLRLRSFLKSIGIPIK